jgi:gamma-glutamyl:cysteine ligase YbdK (ATP-grasp superfamily)
LRVKYQLTENSVLFNEIMERYKRKPNKIYSPEYNLYVYKGNEKYSVCKIGANRTYTLTEDGNEREVIEYLSKIMTKPEASRLIRELNEMD